MSTNKYYWAARDADGMICVYAKKPVIMDDYWFLEWGDEAHMIPTFAKKIIKLDMKGKHWTKSLTRILATTFYPVDK